MWFSGGGGAGGPGWGEDAAAAAEAAGGCDRGRRGTSVRLGCPYSTDWRRPAAGGGEGERSGRNMPHLSPRMSCDTQADRFPNKSSGEKESKVRPHVINNLPPSTTCVRQYEEEAVAGGVSIALFCLSFFLSFLLRFNEDCSSTKARTFPNCCCSLLLRLLQGRLNYAASPKKVGCTTGSYPTSYLFYSIESLSKRKRGPGKTPGELKVLDTSTGYTTKSRAGGSKKN